MESGRKIVSVKEAAKLKGASRAAVYLAISENRLQAIRLPDNDGNLYVIMSSLLEWQPRRNPPPKNGGSK